MSDTLLETLRFPGHEHDCSVEIDGAALRCRESGERAPFVDGVPSLLRGIDDATGVTTKIRSFYEEHPFPSYEGIEEFGSLVSKGRQNRFTRQLQELVGYGKRVLECGCGTGQLTHYLQLNHNHTLGVDLSGASLSLALEHKMRNALPRAGFCQMNLFDLAIKDESFDVVISHGVLHHTKDARAAFEGIVRKVRPGGLVVIGLYNSYARIPTWIRARLIGLLGPRIDYVVRTRIQDPRKAAIWVADQYRNPHETWHSIDEVLGWFDDNGIDYLSTSPGILGTDSEDLEALVTETERGSRYQRVVTQLGWLLTISREGALFDLIGRRR